MAAIRIIRTEHQMPQHIAIIERDEQIHAIALRVAEASGDLSQAKVDDCARRFRDVISEENAFQQLARVVNEGIQQSELSLAVHVDLDLVRIYELLEPV